MYFSLLPLLPLAAPVLAGASYPPKPSDLTTPVQQRIAIHGPNSISIGWNTFQHLPQPCVDYGRSPDSLTRRACSNSSVTYPTSRTWANTVALTELAPATLYWYKIESGNSTAEPLLSPRSPGDETPFAMDVVVDLGVYGEDGFTIGMDMSRRDAIPDVAPALNHTTIGRLAHSADDYELVLHPGDLAYADDWFLRPKNLLDGADAYEAVLEQFYAQLAPVAARKPYMVGPGNHEAACAEIPYATGLCPDGQRNFTDFGLRFGASMPAAFASTSASDEARVRANHAARLARPPFWYSFEYGMAHVVMIDTETDFADAPDGQDGSAGLNGGPFGRSPSQQLDFLAADLASVDRTFTPWIIVAGHRPWYSTGGSDAGCEPCRDAFEPLLYRYGVDLAVFGHVHNAQRFVPVFEGVPDPHGLSDPTAPVYIVAGGAGCIEGLSAVGANATANVFAYADDFSYARLALEDRNRLRVEFVHSASGKILDSSELYKSHAERFVDRKAL